MTKKIKSGSKNTLAKVSFYTFVIAAIAYFVQALLNRIGWGSNLLETVKSVVIVMLFFVVGIMGWSFCKTKSLLAKMLYIVCAIIILVAVVLPVV